MSESPQVPPITKDTRLCISLAGRPASIGTRFHNFLYAELGLDFVYKAFTTDDLPAAIAGIRALGIRGCGVSMPYKQECIPLLDELDPSAEAITAVNTIVQTEGRLRGYNTDYLAVAALLAQHQVPTDGEVVVLGSGGMACAMVAALRDSGYGPLVVVARNASSGPALAQRFGGDWSSTVEGRAPRLLVNATPIGMTGGPDSDRLPVATEVIDAADTVFEVVAVPAETPLLRRAVQQGKRVITGVEVIALQAAEQFALYTGVRPSAEQIRRASAYSRS